jgi:hypothetical protein
MSVGDGLETETVLEIDPSGGRAPAPAAKYS